MPTTLDGMVDAALRLPDDAVARGALRDCLEDHGRWAAVAVGWLVCRFPLARGLRRLSADWFAGAGDADRADLIRTQCDVDAGVSDWAARQTSDAESCPEGRPQRASECLSGEAAAAHLTEAAKLCGSAVRGAFGGPLMPAWCRPAHPSRMPVSDDLLSGQVHLFRPWDRPLWGTAPTCRPAGVLRGGWLAGVAADPAVVFSGFCPGCNGFRVGDVVGLPDWYSVTVRGTPCPRAVVASLDPFVLVSCDGGVTVLWAGVLTARDVTGTPGGAAGAGRSGRGGTRAALARARRDGYPPNACPVCRGGPPDGPFPVARGLFAAHPVVGVHLTGLVEESHEASAGPPGWWVIRRRHLPAAVWDLLRPAGPPDEEVYTGLTYRRMHADLSRALVQWGRGLAGFTTHAGWETNRVPAEGIDWPD